MKTPKIFTQKFPMFVVVGAILLAFYVFALRNDLVAVPENGTTEEETQAPDRVTVTGETGCLPKKGPGPHTMECAIGIQEETTGDWYALNLMVLQTEAGMGLDTGENIRLEGTLMTTGLEQWESYDIVGVILVASLTQGATE